MRSGDKSLIVSIPPHALDADAKVSQCSWSAFGGSDRAVIKLTGKELGLEAYRQLLGQPVEIFTASGSKLWWGYISAVRSLNDNLPQVIDLEPMANRVSACFEELEPGIEPGQEKQTVWYENLQSQLDYGIKEKALRLGMVSTAQANQAVARHLNDHAWPELTLGGHGMGLINQSLDRDPKSRIELICYGWIHRLSWLTWQTISGMLGHSPAQVGAQKIGEASPTQRLGQSFMLGMTQSVSYVKLKLRKEGVPTDMLTISIQSDAAGVPSGTNLASVNLNASSIDNETYEWYQVAFSTLPRLTAGVTYWLVVRRSGLLSLSDYYMAGLDEGAGYLDGVLRMYNSANGQWTARVPVADVLFQMGLLIATDELILELLTTVGKELSGFQVEAPTGLTLAPFVPKPMDGLSALEMLLSLGGADLVSLLASVSPEKWLRVYPKPGRSSPDFMIDQDGNLCDRYGNQDGLESQVAGQWVSIGGGQAVFVNQITWDEDQGQLRLSY